MSAAPVALRRLLPEPGTVTPAEVGAELDLAARASAERPYVVLNMVATVDGAASIGARTAPMSDEADRQLFHELRTCTDAVMVGAGTVRAERYGRLVRDLARREQRVARGLHADPLAVVVSRSLNLPVDVPLLQDPDSRVLIVTAADASLSGCAAEVDYVREADLGVALRRLRAEHGVRSILCEGGPALNASLVPPGLLDELFLSIAPKLAGAAGELTIVGAAALPDPVDLDLIWLLEHEGQLFARYAVLGGARGR